MPGHMNVLLAEANVPYEQLKTADEMNPQMSNVDVAIVIGANDVVNPDAIHDEKGRKMFDVSATRMSRCLEREKILRERSSRNDTDVEVCQSLTLTRLAQYSYLSAVRELDSLVLRTRSLPMTIL